MPVSKKDDNNSRGGDVEVEEANRIASEVVSVGFSLPEIEISGSKETLEAVKAHLFASEEKGKDLRAKDGSDSAAAIAFENWRATRLQVLKDYLPSVRGVERATREPPDLLDKVNGAVTTAYLRMNGASDAVRYVEAVQTTQHPYTLRHLRSKQVIEALGEILPEELSTGLTVMNQVGWVISPFSLADKTLIRAVKDLAHSPPEVVQEVISRLDSSPSTSYRQLIVSEYGADGTGKWTINKDFLKTVEIIKRGGLSQEESDRIATADEFLVRCGRYPVKDGSGVDLREGLDRSLDFLTSGFTRDEAKDVLLLLDDFGRREPAHAAHLPGLYDAVGRMLESAQDTDKPTAVELAREAIDIGLDVSSLIRDGFQMKKEDLAHSIEIFKKVPEREWCDFFCQVLERGSIGVGETKFYEDLFSKRERVASLIVVANFLGVPPKALIREGYGMSPIFDDTLLQRVASLIGENVQGTPLSYIKSLVREGTHHFLEMSWYFIKLQAEELLNSAGPNELFSLAPEAALAPKVAETALMYLAEVGSIERVQQYLEGKGLAKLDSAQAVALRKFWSFYVGLPAEARDVILSLRRESNILSGENKDINERLEDIRLVVQLLNSSSVPEIRRISKQLLSELARAEDPLGKFYEVEDVFVGNSLPLSGKSMLIFSMLYPIERIRNEVAGNTHGEKFSPTLKKALSRQTEQGEAVTYQIFYRDILRIHLESGEPNLKNYLLLMRDGSGVLNRAEAIGIEGLTGEERKALQTFLDKAESLYGRSRAFGSAPHSSDAGTPNLALRIKAFRDSLGIGEGETVTGRLEEMFLKPIGVGSIQEAINRMERTVAEVEARNQASSRRGRVSIRAGDLLKGINATYLYENLRGVVANNFVGAGTPEESDLTPFDVDMSLVLNSDLPRNAVANSLAKDYAGDKGMMALVTPAERIVESTPGHYAYDRNAYEMFTSVGVSQDGLARHVGVRTGFPSTMIKAFVAMPGLIDDQEELSRVKFLLAQNSFYVPLVNEKMEVIYDYAEYERNKLDAKAVIAVADREDFDPSDLIEILKRNEYLRRQYEAQDGFLQNHTLRVGERFEYYFEEDFDEGVISKRAFRLALSLHDVGKLEAVRLTGTSEAQHEYNRKITQVAVDEFGLGSYESEAMVSLVSQDIVGKYIQGSIDLDTAMDLIVTEGKRLDQSPQAVSQLLRIYYICDAGAYTADSLPPQESSFDEVFDHNRAAKVVGFRGAAKEKMDALEERVRSL